MDGCGKSWVLSQTIADLTFNEGRAQSRDKVFEASVNFPNLMKNDN